jgi:hypothetical protein
LRRKQVVPAVEIRDPEMRTLQHLAFDDHISPLLRPVLVHFPGEQSFDGISFSTTIHAAAKPSNAQSSSLSVEFFFP